MYSHVPTVAELQEADVGHVFANVDRANEGAEKLPNIVEILNTDAGRTVDNEKKILRLLYAIDCKRERI